MGQNPCPLGKGTLPATPRPPPHQQQPGPLVTFRCPSNPSNSLTDTNELQNYAFTNKLSSKVARLQGLTVSPKIVPRYQMCPRCASLWACEKEKGSGLQQPQRPSCGGNGPPAPGNDKAALARGSSSRACLPAGRASRALRPSTGPLSRSSRPHRAGPRPAHLARAPAPSALLNFV